MARKSTGESIRFKKAKEKFDNKKLGRPPVEINWKIVEALLEAGCSGMEIAPYFDISDFQLYRRIEEEYGVPAGDFIAQRKHKGNSLLRKKQHDKALEGPGDNSLLIWLGKNRLDQRDTPNEILVSPQTVNQFEELMKQLSSLQDASKSPSSTKIKESKS